jgi:hypothetical protein
VRVRILMVAVLAATLAACDGSPSVEVPDLVGLTLPEAREHAGDFELEEVDASGLDRGVWSPSNWSVAEQEPQAGTPVQPRSTVRVLLVNVRDDVSDGSAESMDEPADDDPAEEPEEPAEEPGEPAEASEEPAPAPETGADERELIALVEQGFEWFTEEPVPFDEDAELWQIQGSVDSITGFRVLGSDFLVATGLHRDNPDSEWVAQGLCGVTASSLHGTNIRRVEVEASNGNRLARCDVLG